MSYPACQLNLTDFRFPVHLGVSTEEKAEPQTISVTVQIDFAGAPQGLKTDQLTDTFCYFAMTQNVHAFVLQHEPFNLVEHLGAAVYACIYRDLLQQGFTDATLKVSVKKLMPPIEGLHGGVTCTYCGLLEQGATDDLYQHWF